MKTKLSTIIIIALLTSIPAGLSYGADMPATYKKHCASCHGNDGKGKTKAGRKAKAKDFTDAAYQASWTDEEGFKSTKEGMTKDGEEKMKAYKDDLSDDEIKELIAFIRTFKS